MPAAHHVVLSMDREAARAEARGVPQAAACLCVTRTLALSSSVAASRSSQSKSILNRASALFHNSRDLGGMVLCLLPRVLGCGDVWRLCTHGYL
jgi:hypothetical protein